MCFSFQRTIEEMHVIAYVYHWDRETLWNMSSRERRMWVKLINTQKKMESDSIKSKTPKVKSARKPSRVRK